MPDLIQPIAELYRPWLEARLEWGAGAHEDGFGLRPDDDTSTLRGFEAWVRRLGEDPGHHWWIRDGDAIAGAIALRADHDPDASRLGHVGYGIRPSFRGRGLATWALAEVLDIAAAHGRERVLIACARQNTASARVIARAGGTAQERDGEATGDRYLVDLTARR